MLGVEGEHPGAGGRAGTLLNPIRVTLERWPKKNPTILGVVADLGAVEVPGE